MGVATASRTKFKLVYVHPGCEYIPWWGTTVRVRTATGIPLYQDMSLRVVTSTGPPTIHQFSVLFKFSISLIF
eukprot:SAG31_NODE_4967_length_2829_cov_3.589744_4_plen_72_part_01